MVWGLLGAAAIGAVSSAFGASQQNKAAKAAAQNQMAFQERMRATQYQTTMSDMKKAGLNPILAYQQGGAGTPGGSSYSPVNVGAAAVQGGQAGVTSAVASRRLNLETRKVKAEIQNLENDSYLKFSQEQLNHEAKKRTTVEIGRTNQEINNLYQQWKMNVPEVTSARSAEKLYKGPFGDFFKWWQMMKRGK